MPEDALDMIFRAAVAPGGKGVPEAEFYRVKAAVGVARERAFDLKRKAAREALEKELAEQKEGMQASIAKVQEAIKTAEPQVTEAAKLSQKLPAEAKALSAPAMLARAGEIE